MAPPELTTPQQQTVLRQLEYYFSDDSFTFDDFLQSEADEAGAVPAATLAAFPRIANMLPEHTEEERRATLLAVTALSDSVMLSGDDRIKRVFPLPKDDEKAARSIYLSGFRKGVVEDEVRAAVAAHARAADFGPVVSIRRLRDLQHSRSFSGACYVEFEDEAKGAAAAAAAAAGELTLPNGKPLKGMALGAHYEAQAEAVEARRRQRDEAKLPEGKAPQLPCAQAQLPLRARTPPPKARPVAPRAAHRASALQRRGGSSRPPQPASAGAQGATGNR